jgi:5,10-methenyltetrahydrofolate synthetase
MQNWPEISAWRKAQRAELIARRAALALETRKAAAECITRLLTEGVAASAGMVVGFCWPYKGEPDPRFALRQWRRQGAVAALPEVVAQGSPLRFRTWWPGAPMKSGVMGIPIPDGTEVVVPDLAIVPVVGYDRRGYRLGYGGGYFDATLAALAPRPVAIGLSYEALRLETIYPQPHDIAMDFIVTETGIHEAAGNVLQAIPVELARERVANLLTVRGLPRRHAAGETRSCSSPPCYAHEFPGYFGESGKESS